jgi:hypothetical protein
MLQNLYQIKCCHIPENGTLQTLHLWEMLGESLPDYMLSHPRKWYSPNSTFVWNVGRSLPDYMLSYPRKLYSSNYICEKCWENLYQITCCHIPENGTLQTLHLCEMLEDLYQITCCHIPENGTLQTLHLCEMLGESLPDYMLSYPRKRYSSNFTFVWNVGRISTRLHVVTSQKMVLFKLYICVSNIENLKLLTSVLYALQCESLWGSICSARNMHIRI